MHMAVVPVYRMVEVIEDPPRLHDDISQICFFSFHRQSFHSTPEDRTAAYTPVCLSYLGSQLALLDVD